MHLALYGGCTALAIACSYFKNSWLLELGSSGPNFSYKQMYLLKKNAQSTLWHSLNWLELHFTCIVVTIFHIVRGLAL